MANFTFKTFGQLLQQSIDTIKANSPLLINFGEGSVIRVLLESVVGLLDYFTIQLKKILLITRAATSTGTDLDSFIADYGMTPRLEAIPAQGTITLTRRGVSSTTVFIAVGGTIISNDNTVTYQVIADDSNPNFNTTANGYYIASNQASVDVTAQATVPGSSGNVLAHTLTIIGSGMPGVDVADNSFGISNGEDAESDSALRARFIQFIESLFRATEKSLEYAISIVQSGLQYVIKENIDINGNPQDGHVIVVIDDGSGSPSGDLLTAIAQSLDLYRAFTVKVDVYAPTILTTSASCSIVVDSGYVASDVKLNVKNAIITYMSNLGFGEFMDVDRLSDIAFSVAGVKSISGQQLNCGTSDIQPLFNQKIKPGMVTVS